MRRSKSNPAKYARNYRSISQRQMTAFDHLDEEQEMKRLQTVLKNSKNHLKQHNVGDDSSDDDDDIKQNKKRKLTSRQEKQPETNSKDNEKKNDDSDDEFERAKAMLKNSTAHIPSLDNKTTTLENGEPSKDAMILKPKKNRKRNRNQVAAIQAEDSITTSLPGQEKEKEKTKQGKHDAPANDKSNGTLNEVLLSEEFRAEHQNDNSVENPLVVFSKKKKKKTKQQKVVELTPQEIKDAKQLQKKTERKLKQLAIRATQKKKRAELYEKLQKSAISAEEFKLMDSSSTLGKRVSKKEQLKKLLQKERAGMKLTEEERDLLYRDRKPTDDNDSSSSSSSDEEDCDNNQPKTDEISRTVRQKKKKKKQKTQHQESDKKNQDAGDDSGDNNQNEKNNASAKPAESSNPAKSFAAQMMASLTSLKVSSEKQKEENDKKKEQEEAERQRREEERLRKASEGAKPYKVTNPIVIQTAATNKKLQVHQLPESNRRVIQVNRPKEVQETRYDLPVTQMEFEVMDAIRNNDVTIICGETGSGKSTQVPQLLYESGFTLGSSPKSTSKEGTDGTPKFMIGITQPRRVAAVSTAKRVCYEMGQGDGKSIKSTKRSKGNLVAYQTRYETAGLGENTGAKFMTDGILLQEIQSDLLLRKYSVIVLDECHERNLNCDILCGLIGLALPLRKKASEEPGSDIVPLKLVIMSATLRVDDFVGNQKLFPTTTPHVLKVPGRTFPVTIHHSKVTELDDYEDAAFQKVCKIHRKLPQGGILVFLTGKQEIVRMVNRLRKALGRRKKTTNETHFVGSNDVPVSRTDITYSSEGGLRDLDDDEIDGDMFQSKDDDYDDYAEDDEQLPLGTASSDDADRNGDNLPKDVIVLPLYSMLSAEEQAKVFAAEQEGHRLIVVSTNIAETSITIPGISYVVDTGREKCKNYDAKTGVASFDISWISKAAANQRAGRAGRTGPGHCYRLYSSSMFSRHMDEFALPEVLTRPLEDVVLAMKAMKISNVSKFPFPTPPAESLIESATRLLSNLGCVNLEEGKDLQDDGEVTHLGSAIATLPLGVRCGKMLLVAAHAGVLDYAIAVIAALSEKNPFLRGEELVEESKDQVDNDEANSSNDDGADAAKGEKRKAKWMHKSGDVYAVMLAIGAYTYAGKGAGGTSEKVACKRFCQENRLNPVIMERIQKIRVHLSRLVKTRMAGADGVAAKTGKIPHSMKPPNKLQERLLLQVIVSSFLDNVAMLAPIGTIPGSHPFSLRSAYLSCSSSLKEPLFIDRNSVLYSRDSRRLPNWVCYDYLVRKNLKDGTPIASMKNVTPVDPSWLGSLAKGSNLLTTGGPLPSPRPTYDPDRDQVMCSVETRFGNQKWEITPMKLPMYDLLRAPEAKNTVHYQPADSFRYFARFLLEGKVFKDLEQLKAFLNDDPSIMTSKTPVAKAGGSNLSTR
ncbi:splicing factor ATP-dependent RNA helicase [Seminavis robusta]|uniref:RNA helicase n=1 Tax=Seminavis robusta TaxID=568900 RepID=A0A9N8D4R7_9STRA|nr:splicing factor ATP-dependent RNA helicase [Seminavis robusta]|eukprot:Sro4_g003320.1 splicing factor ATP-dependent RNA helicase (1431) ;mRNA; r:116237-121116